MELAADVVLDVLVDCASLPCTSLGVEALLLTSSFVVCWFEVVECGVDVRIDVSVNSAYMPPIFVGTGDSEIGGTVLKVVSCESPLSTLFLDWLSSVECRTTSDGVERALASANPLLNSFDSTFDLTDTSSPATDVLEGDFDLDECLIDLESSTPFTEDFKLFLSSSTTNDFLDAISEGVSDLELANDSSASSFSLELRATDSCDR